MYELSEPFSIATILLELEDDLPVASETDNQAAIEPHKNKQGYISQYAVVLCCPLDLLQRFANLLQEAIESHRIINNNLNELTKLVSSICQKQAALQVEVDVLSTLF
ncbi:hypothetical protein HanPSC8_Chr14g0622261 [Helianthus annuus]|nr:hypothetical protein HanPSC8_Chr14g0622261 [Helianthus annuus]